MKDCSDFEFLISLYIDNKLGHNEKQELEKHLNDCEKCKKLYEDMNSIISELNNLTELDLPNDFHENLIEKINHENLKIKRINYFKKYSAAAAVFFVVAFVSFGVKIYKNDYENNDMTVQNDSLEVKEEVSNEFEAAKASAADIGKGRAADETDKDLGEINQKNVKEDIKAYSPPINEREDKEDVIVLDIKESEFNTAENEISEYISEIEKNYSEDGVTIEGTVFSEHVKNFVSLIENYGANADNYKINQNSDIYVKIFIKKYWQNFKILIQ